MINLDELPHVPGVDSHNTRIGHSYIYNLQEKTNR